MNIEYYQEVLREGNDELKYDIAQLENEVDDLKARSVSEIVAHQKHRLMLGLDADLTLAEFLDRLEAM